MILCSQAAIRITIAITSFQSLNPFLFITRPSDPHCAQASLSSIPGYPYNLLPVFCADIGFKKKYGSSIDLEIRPQSDFTASRSPLPAVNYPARLNSPLQIVMVCFFIEFEARQRTMIICSQAAIRMCSWAS